MRKTAVCLILTLLVFLNGNLYGQGRIAEVIDTPTANPVDFGSYSLSFRFYEGGSILTRLFYGMIMRDLTLGLSFDAENVAGSGRISPRRPFLYVKMPLYGGGRVLPAVSLGYDEQGFGRYDSDTESYQYKPLGFFLVFTGSGIAPGLSAGGGVNADYAAGGGSEKIKGFLNAAYTIGPEFILTGEVSSIGDEPYGGLGFRYLLRPELHFELAVINIGGAGKTERILRATYKGAF